MVATFSISSIYFDNLLGRCIKQRRGRAGAPLAVRISEIPLDGMAEHRCHDSCALAPGHRKIVVELIVLDEFVPTFSLGSQRYHGSKCRERCVQTVLTPPPPR
jgi:hypothetical protein